MRRRARTDLCGGRSVMAVPTATVGSGHPSPIRVMSSLSSATASIVRLHRAARRSPRFSSFAQSRPLPRQTHAALRYGRRQILQSNGGGIIEDAVMLSITTSAVSSSKKRHQSSARRKRSQGRRFLAFISTLDAASASPTMERGTKRSAVQLSFVPWLKVLLFVASDLRLVFCNQVMGPHSGNPTSHLFGPSCPLQRGGWTMITASISPPPVRGEAGCPLKRSVSRSTTA